MPTLLNRTFALLNNIKPPFSPERVDKENTPSDTETNDQKLTSPKTEYAPDMTIWKAAELGNLEALQYYVRHTNGVDPVTLLNTRDPESNCTLLHLVISNNNNNSSNMEQLVRFLLENGADGTARNVYNVQAIHMISLHCPNPLSCIQLLLDHSSNPNARDGDGWTPLHYAARFCQPPDKIVQLLTERGADVNLIDAGHKSPLFGLLANGDFTTCLDWLIHHAGADVTLLGDFFDQQDRITRQGTIVLQAAKYGRLESLSLLIKSRHVLNKLAQVVTQDQMDYANKLVKEQQARLSKSTDLLERYNLILQLLQELEDTLLKDRHSLMYKAAERSLPSKAIQRRYPSIRTLVETFRRRRHSPKQDSTTTSKITKRMNSLMGRDSSEHRLGSNEMSSGISR
ncbi:ankyrin [Backusella circina FSU 941]|nr:ankyrin [Backusella circina FSU 941]